MVPVGKRARVLVGGKVGLQPLLLQRAYPASADLVAVAVQDDHVPGSEVGSEVVGVVAPAVDRTPGFGRGRGVSEVAEVARSARGGRGSRRVVLVVAHCGLGESFVLAPIVVAGGIEDTTTIGR